MYTHRISYSKEFLSGTLTGICVRCHFKTTADALRLHMNALQGTTKDQPAVEGNGTYWIYNVGCEELQPITTQQTCIECGHVANVQTDCKLWACAGCARIQVNTNAEVK